MAKVKHLKTKTTIQLTLEEVHDWTKHVNEIDMMLDNISDMKDLYMSDVSNLDTIRWRLVRLLNLDWNRDEQRYVKGEDS
tara:strand:+ start:88 stop:327 length:240 start_codon:yes stop_codon:yes gene_type:complete